MSSAVMSSSGQVHLGIPAKTWFDQGRWVRSFSEWNNAPASGSSGQRRWVRKAVAGAGHVERDPVCSPPNAGRVGWLAASGNTRRTAPSTPVADDARLVPIVRSTGCHRHRRRSHQGSPATDHPDRRTGCGSAQRVTVARSD